jgi:hypothetical protein
MTVGMTQEGETYPEEDDRKVEGVLACTARSAVYEWMDIHRLPNSRYDRNSSAADRLDHEERQAGRRLTSDILVVNSRQCGSTRHTYMRTDRYTQGERKVDEPSSATTDARRIQRKPHVSPVLLRMPARNAAMRSASTPK